ncbi:hypothetical protein FACS1894116_07550 [Betaproteobacteria bacterium]|nr:hypothetical protein FACS1894116_07550 [Betaproteobacteria bacterium]GHU26963.1 hypothetical protein FACS189488_15090 [Betaproteobacteria bacterium]
MTDWMLDPPERYAPVARWQAWLDDLRTMSPDDPGVAQCITDAEKTLAWRAEAYPHLAADESAYGKPPIK